MRTNILALALALAAPALAGCIGETGPGVGTGDEAATPEDPLDPGWPALDEATVRPGVTIASGGCTANFVFNTPDNTTLFIGTAAHCFPDAEIGQSVEIAGGAVTGSLAYSSFLAMNETGEDIAGNDFALVEIPDDAREAVHPAMLTFGGPTGVAESVTAGDRVLAHGNSSARPSQAPGQTAPREGVVTEHTTWTTGMYFAGPGIPGDSGSPVLTGTGEALGDVITLEIAPQPASNNVANLAATLAYSNEHMDESVELATWPLIDGGAVPTVPSPTGGVPGSIVSTVLDVPSPGGG